MIYRQPWKSMKRIREKIYALGRVIIQESISTLVLGVLSTLLNNLGFRE